MELYPQCGTKSWDMLDIMDVFPSSHVFVLLYFLVKTQIKVDSLETHTVKSVAILNNSPRRDYLELRQPVSKFRRGQQKPTGSLISIKAVLCIYKVILRKCYYFLNINSYL